MKRRLLLASKKEKRFFGFLTGILLICIIISIIFETGAEKKIIPAGRQAYNPFANVQIVGKSAYVYDLRTGAVLYSKSPDTRLPLASLTKVMTALVATNLAPSTSVITVSDAALQTDGDSGLFAGERFALKNILDFSLTSSSNDGMVAVAMSLGDMHVTNASQEDSEADFVVSMNKEANALGMKNTYYFNPTGLDESAQRGGAYGSAHDMAILFSYILEHKPTLLEATAEQSLTIHSLDNLAHTAQNTDALVDDIPGLIGSKTGYTDLAGGNLTVAFDPEIGRPVIIAVLGSTETNRFTDVQKLVNATFNYLDMPTTSQIVAK